MVFPLLHIFCCFPISVMQVSSNMEGEKMSITKAVVPGAFVEIICDLITQTANISTGTSTRRAQLPRNAFFTTYISYSKVVLESGISEGKYQVYKEKSYTLQSQTCKKVILECTTVLSGEARWFRLPLHCTGNFACHGPAQPWYIV